MPVVTDTSALSRFETTKAKTSEDLSRIWFFWKETKNKEDKLSNLSSLTVFLALLRQL